MPESIANSAECARHVRLQDLIRQRRAEVDQGEVGPEVVAEQFGQHRVTAVRDIHKLWPSMGVKVTVTG